MSFLAKVEDWIVRHTLKPLQPWMPLRPLGHPQEDDMLLSLMVYLAIMVAAGSVVGTCLAK